MSSHDVDQAHEQEMRQRLASAEARAPDDAGDVEQPEPAQPDAAGIRWNDRVLVLGFTGAGKSALLDHLFGVFRVQRLLLDTKGHEFEVIGDDGQALEPTRDVDAIDWQQPIIHYVDRTGTADEYDELFAACHRRRRLIVRVDELADVCEYQPNRAPLGFRQYTAKGRAHGQGLLAASQRPHLIPSAARTEAQHVFIFGPRLDPEDHRTIAKTVGMRDEELGAMIDKLPDYGFYWWDKQARQLRECPPLPDHLRARSIVRRRTVA